MCSTFSIKNIYTSTNTTPLVLLCAKKGQTTSLKQARKNKSLEFIKLIDVDCFKKLYII